MATGQLATVAMVTYNSAAFIAEAIESVLCSSYTQLELLICDDASQDATWEIVQRYRDPRIRAVRNPKNLGEYANRNQAIALAQGEYFSFIDGDDLLYPHGLEFMVRLLDAYPQAAFAMALPWSEKFVYPVQLSAREFYLTQYLGPGALGINFTQLCFRTAALRAVGGFDLRYRAGDVYIQYRLGLQYPCLLINDGLAWWRRTPGQASEKLTRSLLGWPELLEFQRAFLTHPNCPLTRAEVAQALANLYNVQVRVAVAQALRGNVRAAIRMLYKSRLPASAWRHALHRGRYPYLADVTAAQPLKDSQRKHPWAQCPAEAP